MLSCAHEKWLSAALYFAAAACFRSNGILLAGFIIWGVIIRPFIQSQQVCVSFHVSGMTPDRIQLPDTKSASKAVLTTALILSPFMGYHYAAYRTFCISEHRSEYPWCANRIPLIYSYVQSKYWNVGFLRYWTLSQAPNFLLAAPVLVLTTLFCSVHLRGYLLSIVNRLKSKYVDVDPFLRSDLAPYTIHCLLLNMTLLFFAHTQIALRFSAATPVTYWAAAWLISKSKYWGRVWVGWSFIWGAISTVLWVAFLPPA
jgi:phosphatidylinositol glycan class V